MSAALQPPGAQWCARYPTSTSTDALAEPFRACVVNFISALRQASAMVHVSATYRPPERAWLMHYACRIASGSLKPADVPTRPGLDIDWTHGGDTAAAIAGAAAMVKGYDIRFPAALGSLHIERRAIDMTISWAGTLKIRDGHGKLCSVIAEPRNGSNPVLAEIGKTFGVFKLKSDPPHWSDDGH